MKKQTAVAALTAVALTVGGTTVSFAADVTATAVAARATSTWSPPSSDPSGIAFIPGKGLLVSDAEVEETLALSQSTNLFTSSLDGVKTGQGSTVGWSNEPTGVFYVAKAGNPWNGHLFVTDDDRKEVFDISGAGTDGQFGTADDGGRTSFKTSPFGNTDPEDVAFDSVHNELWLAGGLSTIISRVNPGADNNFATAGDNLTANFEIPQLDPTKPPSPEGMAYDPARGTILVLDGESTSIFEFARNGALLNTISLASINMQSPGGITMDPASTGSTRTYYIADRGLDPNGTRTPAEFNDGVIHEVRVSLPAVGNIAPLANAGPDDLADELETVTLLGSGEDGESPASPGPLSYTWKRMSGPGTVTLGTPNAPTTTASFSAAGTHVMRLTVSDGALSDFDEAVITVYDAGAQRAVTVPVATGSDDALENLGGTSDGFTDLLSADNELGNTGATPATNLLTGLRFVKLPVPKGSTINSAKIQFSVDETGSSAASYVIRGQATANAPTFLQGNNVANGSAKNISSRPSTAATVAWNNVPAWTTVRDEGPAQRTPELAPILQEIVNLPEWTRGNPAVFMIQNATGNTGRRTAEAKDGRIPPHLMLTFTTPTNLAPLVNAGPDSTVTLPGLASLDGTVTDDGNAAAITTTWSKVSGPGSVTFGDASQQDTTAAFGKDGTFVLQLTATDGVNTSSDRVTVTVSPAGSTAPPPGSVQPKLTATVSDGSVPVGSPTGINGTLSPALDGQTVHLQRLSGTTWGAVSSATVTGGASASVSFTVTSSTSGSVQYRLVAPAMNNYLEAVSNSITVKYQKVKVAEVRYASDVVVLKNLGTVRTNLKGWTVKNKKNGKQVVLPFFVLKPGKVVYIHTGKGSSTRKHLYLAKRDMWGKHGKAVLRDDGGSAAGSLRY